MSMRATPGLAVALVVLLAGCSKSEPLVNVGNGPSEPSDVAPSGLSPADRCFAACDQKHSVSAAVFDALDDCSEANCKLGIDDAPLSPKACAAIDQKKITYNYDEVDNCIASVCCAEATACAADADCAAASACYDTCVALH